MALFNKVLPLISIAAVTTALTYVGPTSQTALAATSSHYWDGGEAENIATSNPAGAQANITPDNPYVGDGGFSSAWAMIANRTTGSYAQMGWTKDVFNGQTQPYKFSAWFNSSTMTNEAEVYYGTVGGGAYTYGVQDLNRNGSYGGDIDFTVDGSTDGTVLWNNVFGSNPANDIEYYGEITSSNAQMPGTSSNPVWFENIQYESWHSSGDFGAWATPSLNTWATGDSTSRLDNSTYNSTDGYYFRIWDTASFAQ